MAALQVARLTATTASPSALRVTAVSATAPAAASALRVTAVSATVATVVPKPRTGPTYPSPTTWPSRATYPSSATPPPVVPPTPPPVATPTLARVALNLPTWTVVSRTADYHLSVTLPLVTLQGVRRWLGVDTAVLTTPYTTERWASLGPGCGLVCYRNGGLEFSGLVRARQLDWDRKSGAQMIRVEAVGDTQVLADRLVFPDPGRAPDDQTVNDYWTTSGLASTAMWRAISDAAGPTCRPDRRVPALAMGADPGKGASRAWTGLFDNLLTWLAATSVASGANLGVRATGTAGALTVDVVAPSDKADLVKFSADLSNMVGFTYREEAPTVTDAVAAGQGDLHARVRQHQFTTDPVATAWGRQVFDYVDRRDTADLTVLTQAANDALIQGAPKVSLTATLTDSQAATYGRDWGLGTRVTVYVGLPGQAKVATVTDVVREISFTVAADGSELITPAIGTYDATAVIPTPTQQQLARVGVALGNLIART